MSNKEPQPSTRPRTASLLSAEFRRGLKDLQNAVLNPWNGVVATHEEPGTIGSPTQAMVTQEVGTVQGYQAMLDGYAARGPQAVEQERGIER
jgi:hypothetical protein